MTTRISLGGVWEETIAFVRAELALLMPVALAGFALPLIALQLLLPARLMIGDQIAGGPWGWALPPYALCSMTATLALTALALRPGISVRESLVLAVRRLPAAIGLVLLALAALIGLSVLVSLAAAAEQGVLGRSGPVFVVALLLFLVTIISVLVRALPVWAVLIDGDRRPIAAIRRAFALTRSHYLLLLLLRVVAWLSQSLALFVVLVPVAVLFNLLGRLTGAPRATELLSLIVGGAMVAVLMAIWTVYTARFYRRLAGSISGT